LQYIYLNESTNQQSFYYNLNTHYTRQKNTRTINVTQLVTINSEATASSSTDPAHETTPNIEDLFSKLILQEKEFISKYLKIPYATNGTKSAEKA
jgi:hypothetical protein